MILTKFPVHSTCWILPGTCASEYDKRKRVSIPQQADDSSDGRGFAAVGGREKTVAFDDSVTTCAFNSAHTLLKHLTMHRPRAFARVARMPCAPSPTLHLPLPV